MSKLSKLNKAADIGLIDNVPKKGMGGISSTFNIEDLSSLFNEYVGLKKDGKLINPQYNSSQNETNEYKSSQKSRESNSLTRGDMTEESFRDTMNNWFGQHVWNTMKKPENKQRVS